MRLAVMSVALVVSTLALPVAQGHDQVFPVGGHYLVVNSEETYVQVWQETNGLEGLQREPVCIDHPPVICHDADAFIAGQDL